MNERNDYPAGQWQKDARFEGASLKNRLRLAAMAGHMQVDKIAARRAALIDLLADGRPYSREAILAHVEAQVGVGCWGKVARESLARDLSVLRKGGIQIEYARRPEIRGYYLGYPVLKRPFVAKFESTNWQLVEKIKTLSVAEKNERAFAAAEFALQQKQLILKEEHPDWTPQVIEAKAREMVFGI